jgi:hypothetical protein
MVGACKSFEQALVSIAEGQNNPEAEAHVAECASCGRKVAELRKVLQAIRLPQFDVPTELVSRAAKLMPNRRRQLFARLLTPRPQFSVARSLASGDLALQVGVDDLVVRMLLTPIGSAANPREWEVAGIAPSPDWHIVREDSEVACGESGRFKFSVSRLSETAFLLRSSDVELVVPSAQELIDDES